jgi:hypothetical protein
MIALSLSIFAAVALMASTPSDAAAKTITLRAVCFLPAQTTVVRFLPIYAERVTKKSKGELLSISGRPGSDRSFVETSSKVSRHRPERVKPFIDKVPRLGLACRVTAPWRRKNGIYSG